jgi:hypothetical protein
VVRQTGSGWSIQLTVSHLADLGSGQVYECWWLGPGSRPVPAGSFTVGSSGTATVQMGSGADPDKFPTMEITKENPVRANQPGQVVLSGIASD